MTTQSKSTKVRKTKTSSQIEAKIQQKKAEQPKKAVQSKVTVKTYPAMQKETAVQETSFAQNSTLIYHERFQARVDELKWLYMELYHGADADFDRLCNSLFTFYEERGENLKQSDLKREKNPDWYLSNKLIGMMLYVDNFAGDLNGVRKHLDYLAESNINYVHLMPLLDTTEGKSDGGYAVSDYRKVVEKLGTMEDLAALTKECHERDICVCLDYVMNHTSEDHEWAKKARAGEKEYQDRYFFYDDYGIPAQFEKTVPEVFPKTAPGNFTYLPKLHKFVMTSFYPYQWDLNYWNPIVFNEMTANLLFLANKGIDIIRIDAVPYIWKQLGTNCRNLPQVHTIVRMLRLITEIVCPGVVLLGEVVMEPKELAPYFGTVEKPECHMLYNATTMCTLWHTVATKDVRLLRYQTDQVVRLPKNYGFLNYIRCHDDIGWGLDFAFLKQFGMEEVAHKRFLNEYFQGYLPFSTSVGELYNEDPVTGDARFCATTASMCGIERGCFEQNPDKIKSGICLDLMLHAFLLFQSGIPVIYSGDEIGQFNDWSYHNDPLKKEDSRYLHRGVFSWKEAFKASDPDTVAGQVHMGLDKLEKGRISDPIFDSFADVYTIETHNQSVLGMIRISEKERVIGLFNFSDMPQNVWITEFEEEYRDFFSNSVQEALRKPSRMTLAPYEYMWAVRV